MKRKWKNVRNYRYVEYGISMYHRKFELLPVPESMTLSQYLDWIRGNLLRYLKENETNRENNLFLHAWLFGGVESGLL